MLILIAHGSRDPNWRAAAERLTESLQARVGPDAVRLAYLQCTPPTLMEVVVAAVEAGVRKIRVLPLFLTDEGHVTRDIQPLIERVRATHQKAKIELLPAIGQQPKFVDFLCEIARQAGE